MFGEIGRAITSLHFSLLHYALRFFVQHLFLFYFFGTVTFRVLLMMMTLNTISVKNPIFSRVLHGGILSAMTTKHIHLFSFLNQDLKKSFFSWKPAKFDFIPPLLFGHSPGLHRTLLFISNLFIGSTILCPHAPFNGCTSNWKILQYQRQHTSILAI